MVYCTRCGKQNDDQAVFCISCGERLSGQNMSPASEVGTPTPGQAPVSLPGSTILYFSLSHGDHKVILGEVDFTDEGGHNIYVASRESALHQNYTVSQGGSRLLFMKHKMSLGGYSYELQDGSGGAIGELHCKIIRRGELSRCWYTDLQGNSQVELQWGGAMRFTLSDPGFARTYAEAAVELPGGLSGDLKALLHRRYKLSLPQGPSVPVPVVLAFCVAVADGQA